MLSEIMRDINNHFAIDSITDEFFDYESGIFKLVDGKIAVRNKYVVGQYIAVTGSILNNGVYQVEEFADSIITIKQSETNDGIWGEEFDGTIYSLIVPYDFLKMVSEIQRFAHSQMGEASNVTSASFGIQSFSFGTDASGVRAGWQTVFRQRLNKYRRMTPDIVI